MTTIWKVEEIEWINKIGTNEKVADKITYSCNSTKDSHTASLYGEVLLVSNAYLDISDDEYKSLKSQAGAIDYKHEENTDTEGKKRHTGTIYKTTTGSYTEYESLTEEKVLGWVKAKLGEDKVKDLENSVETILKEDIDTGNTFKHTSSLPF
tara:strand:- start:51 stop:506 length:456 start_codon:yes stop_codon:yes gene_type:complete